MYTRGQKKREPLHGSLFSASCLSKQHPAVPYDNYTYERGGSKKNLDGQSFPKGRCLALAFFSPTSEMFG
jgi:hypothetical protein